MTSWPYFVAMERAVEALVLARQAVEEGLNNIPYTPEHDRYFRMTADAINEAMSSFQNYVEDARNWEPIKITRLPIGTRVTACKDFPGDDISEGDKGTITANDEPGYDPYIVDWDDGDSFLVCESEIKENEGD